MPDAREPNYNWYESVPRDSLLGWVASETVFFSLGKDEYAINLTALHADELRSTLAPFIERARKVGEKSIENLREDLNKSQGEIYYQPPLCRVDRPMALTDDDNMSEFPGELPEGPPPNPNYLPLIREDFFD